MKSSLRLFKVLIILISPLMALSQEMFSPDVNTGRSGVLSEGMNDSSKKQAPVLDTEHADNKTLFNDGNYAMFIHWGMYSMLANRYQDSTYYGIGEWMMHPAMAGIPAEEYKELAENFNPVNFNAEEIVQLAKDAGMKYIVITSKHHDGFAMFHSRANEFNIVDATPFDRDPMKELARACKKAGLGFGFYYSQNQDWTAPGGHRGPKTDAQGNPKTFNDYFYDKCLLQVKEITSHYGDIVLVWFDTPGGIKQQYVEELISVVRKNQPDALISGRVGHNMGDYKTLGDMEIPVENVEGMWETVDVTNDSWGYAWYDENWKSPEEILNRLVSTVSRGGTYMLNIGPKGDGSIPADPARSLRSAGEWIKKYPQVVYGTGPSPWQHQLPWGDVTVKSNRLYLAVYDWPLDGKIFLPGLETKITSAALLNGERKNPIEYSKEKGWICFQVPYQRPEKMVSVIQVDLAEEPEVNPLHGIDPGYLTSISAHFAEAEGCRIEKKSWMEKFGEWKHQERATQWEENGKISWHVDVCHPGQYKVKLKHSGSGKIVWKVETDEGKMIQNQQHATDRFHECPIGWLEFKTPGKHKVTVSLVEGAKTTGLSDIIFKPVQF
ncbi:MAG: alpha-L-fucosidase [Bacteroidales bacterium]|nr:alpha-L-fucosidase [Bacteroidales bacterium]